VGIVVIRNVRQLLLEFSRGRRDMMVTEKKVFFLAVPWVQSKDIPPPLVTVAKCRLGPGFGNPSLRMSDQRGQFDRAWKKSAPALGTNDPFPLRSCFSHQASMEWGPYSF
jgi:hypothetical protein